ncbi:XXYS1_4_G0028470.mRNA.1.CDS.1 [Saccharomyces cerevisiae]|nr:XXYS1_4_G0028470.mRNA.1.CDS.1 [Saccharomyces cerevisiae]
MTNDIKEIQTIQPGLSEIKEIKGELANVKKRKRRSKKINKLTIKINYHLLTSIYVTSILSYTVLEDDTNDEK